jgi:hypothetical protein
MYRLAEPARHGRFALSRSHTLSERALVLELLSRVSPAREIEEDLRRLLAAADPDLPIVVELQKRAER